MPRQPVTNGRLAALDSLRDFGDRHAPIDKGLELAPFQPAARRVLPVVGRAQPMFLDPIGDRRFVTPEPAADLPKRKPVPSSSSSEVRSIRPSSSRLGTKRSNVRSPSAQQRLRAPLLARAGRARWARALRLPLPR